MDIKKIIAGTTAVAVIATQALSSMAFAANTAIANQAWTDAVNFMKTQGLSSTANSVAEYMPMATVKREAASKFFVEFAKKEFGMKPDTTKVCNFSDINKANSVFVPYIIEACQMGILHGVNGKFLPKATLTKLQFLTVLARIVKNNPAIQPAEAFNILKADGITKADSLASTVRPVSRIELAMLFQRAVAKYANTNNAPTTNNTNSNDNSNIGSILSGILGGSDNTTTTTPATTTGNTTTTTTTTNNAVDQLVVALDPATPRDQYVPGTGVDIKVLKLDLTAGSKDVTLKALTVSLGGMIARDHITNVYLENASGAIISNQRSFGTDYTARLVINNTLVVKAGTTESIYVALDVKNSTNELIKVSIPSANDVEASSTVAGQFPIESYVVHTTAYTSETLKFEPELTTTTNTYYVGDTNKEVARFKLTAGDNHQKDITIKSVRLKLSDNTTIGSVSTDLDNFKLVVNGQNVVKSAVMDGRYVTFTLNYTIPYGESRTFYVYADIIGVQSPAGDTVAFKVDKTSDISALEADTNAAVNVNLNDNNGTTMETNTIKEGDNLITKSSESPVATTIPYDTTDIPVLVANVNVSNEMEVDKFDVYFKVFSGSASTTQVTGANTIEKNYVKNVKLYINGKLVDVVSTYDYGTGDHCEHGKAGYNCAEFSYYGNLKGSNKFTVKIDTPSKLAYTNERVDDITIDGNSFVDATYTNTDNVVKDSDIKGSAENGPFTIVEPEFSAVSRVDGFSNPDTMVAGATDYKVLGAQVQANNVGSLTINTITTDINVSHLAAGTTTTGKTLDYISTAKLVVNGQVVDTENVNGDTVTFNSLNINVPKAGTAKFDVLLDTTTNLSGASFSVSVPTSGMVATDEAGNTVTNNTPINGVTWNVVNAATLAITLNSNSPVEQVVAANPNVETEVARFDLRPTNDSAQIQELVLKNMSGDNVTTNADSLIQNVYIYDTNGNKLGTASLASGVVDFNFTNAIDLPQNKTTTLVVKVQPNAINSLSLTNKFVDFAIAASGSTTQKTRIISVSNGSELTVPTETANKIYFRKTLLTFANDAQTTTSLVNGSNDIYLWSATADQAGAAKIKEFNLDLSMNGASLENGTGDYELYINGSKVTNTNVNIVANGTGSNATGVVITFTGNYINGYEVSAGSTVNFKLVATNVANAQTNDSITVRLNQLAPATDAANIYTGGQALNVTNSVVWSDEASKDTTTMTTTGWFTDADLLSLPLNGETITK